MAISAIAACVLSNCAVVKTTGAAASLPFKAAYKTTKVAGKTVWTVGKGVYFIGSVPVKITDTALNTTSKVLTVTTQALDATGKVVTMTTQIKAAELNAELAMIERSANIISVFVDTA